MKSAFLIAAPTSGSGKTTIARGLMALLASEGYKVQPFKCGPDYIDTKFHEMVCERPSINLDTFMATPAHVRELFAHYGEDADVCIVEGMMGLFDGYDRDKGSSAEIAQVLDIPVVLVVDAKSAAYSIAPLLSGFINFRPNVHIAGVIFNKVGSERHYLMLQQVCDDLGITCFGYLPKQASLEQSSRYLGLDFSAIAEKQALIPLMNEHVEWRRLLTFNEITARCPRDYGSLPTRLRLVIARNHESFSFIYQENIEACRKAIRDYAERGGRIQAECGGMMYLCENIVTDDGSYPMCGVLPYTITARQADKKLSLGYRRFVLDGKEYRGHEFHYTQFVGATPTSVVQVCNAKGEPVTTPVFRYKNVLASYTHLYEIIG